MEGTISILSISRKMADHNDLGIKGEQLAVQFLKSKGHEILELNYRYSRAEVDIVSRVGDCVVFTEVKTRGGRYFGNPEEFVDEAKQQKMALAAENFLDEHKLNCELRFDIISIFKNETEEKVKHFQDAFYPLED